MMSRRVFACVGVLLVFAAGRCLAQPLKIVEIGDSITQGRGTEPQTQSWRYPFWKLLVDYGIEFDTIGSMDGGFNGDPYWPDYQGIPFDRDHEGHWGWTSWGILDRLPGWISNYDGTADIAMFLLGTNGSGEAGAVQRNVDCHRDMIDLFRAENPDVVVLLGLPFQEWDPFPEMRQAYTDLATEMSTPQSPVIPVDHSPGWVSYPDAPDTCTVDWVHPNQRGDAMLADNWFAAFREIEFPDPTVPGDLSRDGVLDGHDIDMMRAEVGSGGSNLYYDADGDGTVDQADVDAFIRVTLGTEYGDANLDGLVSDADYTIWADHYGQTNATWTQADFNGNGNVTEADYTIWADYYGAGVGEAPVPEPATMVVLGLGAAAMAWRRR